MTFTTSSSVSGGAAAAVACSLTASEMEDVQALVMKDKWREALGIMQKKGTNPNTSEDLRVVPLQCTCLMQLERHDEALDILDRLLKKRKGWAAGWLVRAKVLFDLGEYEKALESISDDVNGTKHLRKGAPRHLIDEARSLRDCITQIMASGANEHQRGNEAFQCEEFHRAAKHYRRAIQGQCDRQVLGTLHSNLSACYFKMGHMDVSTSEKMWKLALSHAEECIKLRPGWIKGLNRKSDAISALNTIRNYAALNASGDRLRKTFENLSVDQKQNKSNTANGGEEKRGDVKLLGDEAFKSGDFDSALRHYSKALSEAKHPKAKVLSNRSACYAKLGRWFDSLKDAQQALQLSPKWAKAWTRVGCAMQGLGNLLDAYCVLCKGLGVCSEGREQIQQSMLELLALIPTMDTHVSLSSSQSSRCFQRFKMDSTFSRHKTRIFCISDVHIDQHGNLGWFKTLSNQNFKNDVLIIAGDIGDTMNAVRICLKEFRKRFRRVFMCPGNHDLWIRKDTSDAKIYPDSIAKLGAMHNVCQECDVDLGPAEVAEGLYVVPLFSWYNHTFDEKDPNPGALRFDSFCKWPPNMSYLQVWKYFLQLNKTRVEYDYKGSYSKRLGGPIHPSKSEDPFVFSFSHFLPRAELPYPWGVSEMAKAVGCKELDLQIQDIRSDIHVFGHTHMDTDTLVGNKYISDKTSGKICLGSEKNQTRYVQSALDGGGSLYQLYGNNILTGTRVDSEGKPI